MNNIKILPLTTCDFEALGDLAGTIWRSHYSRIISLSQIEYMLEGRFDAGKLEAYLNSDTRWFDVLWSADQRIGYSSYSLLANHGEMKLEQLYLLDQYRGEGLGKFMLQRIESAALEKNQRVLILQVNKHNEGSIAFYRKAGFNLSAESVFDIGNGFIMDDYVMKKTL